MIRAILESEREAAAGLFAAAPEASRWSAQDIAQLQAAGARVWVDVEDGEVAGAVASREVAGEAEILNLAVGALWRRRGIGRRLMQTAVEGAISRGVRRVFLEVRESNGGARAFYSGLGFAQQGRRRKYYQDPVEDALLLSRTF
jgi:ribosomal-protein-alanine N-acetyltransferase